MASRRIIFTTVCVITSWIIFEYYTVFSFAGLEGDAITEYFNVRMATENTTTSNDDCYFEVERLLLEGTIIQDFIDAPHKNIPM